LLSTNGNAFNTKINGVGKHIIKADPLNHPCAAPLTLEETIEPIGRVEFFNIFTPDGDGKNDRYFVEIEKYENFSIQIFDEAGSTVYTSQNPQEGWDGTVFNNGNKCRAGAYTAKISYTLIGESPTVKSQRLQLRRQ